MIEANKRLFGQLARAGGSFVSSDLAAQRRAILTSAEDKKWLQEMTLQTLPQLSLGPGSKVAIGRYRDDFYLIAIGFELDQVPEDFVLIPPNPGMFTAIVSELEVPVVKLPDLQRQILEYVFYPVAGKVELIDFEVVKPFFSTIQCFSIESASALLCGDDAPFRSSIAAVLACSKAIQLSWPNSSLERIEQMIRDPEEKLPFHLLLRALTESREDAAFLAVYRCIEQLFPIPKIAELSAELSISRPTLQLAATIERHLGWRRREDDAIAHLFGELDGGLIGRIAAVIGMVSSEEMGARPISKRVYELRNQCVHYRPVHSDGEFKAVDWLSLSDLLIEAGQCLYSKYSSAFDKIEELVVT